MSNDKKGPMSDDSAESGSQREPHNPNNIQLDSSSGRHSRRDSRILVEGIEYDLSNLLVDGSTNNNHGSDSHKNKEEDDDDDSDSDSDSGFLTCLSRGTPSRNGSNASSVFENHPSFLEHRQKAARRQSPYRFDVDAMRTLMTSFRGIPELQDSFRLNKSGQIVEVMDGSFSLSHNDNDHDSEDDDELLLLANSNRATPVKHQNSDNTTTTTKTAATTSSCASTTSCADNSHSSHNPSSTLPVAGLPDQPLDQEQEVEEEVGIDDLVFDEATGTYVYRDYEYSYPEQPPQEQQPVKQEPYHDTCQSPNEPTCQSLEEVAAQAALGDDGGGGDDDEDHEMEISPGVYVPFRGAKETWQAVATQTTHELECFDCGASLVCINDCEFTVCPDCRVVNPVFCDTPLIDRPFGVGMGFKKEWVVKKLQIQPLEQETANQRTNGAAVVREPSQRRLASRRK